MRLRAADGVCNEPRKSAARRDWRCMGVVSEAVPYGFLIACYRRRMGVVVAREMARHRYRQSQLAGLTRLQLDEIRRERQAQRQGGGASGGTRGALGGARTGAHAACL